jgi:hypothetical protein
MKRRLEAKLKYGQRQLRSAAIFLGSDSQLPVLSFGILGEALAARATAFYWGLYAQTLIASGIRMVVEPMVV